MSGVGSLIQKFGGIFLKSDRASVAGTKQQHCAQFQKVNTIHNLDLFERVHGSLCSLVNASNPINAIDSVLKFNLRK